MSDDKKPSDAMRGIEEALTNVETLLKTHELGSELARTGVNIALALVALDGLRAYIRGDKAAAIEDLGTAVEEIAVRASVIE